MLVSGVLTTAADLYPSLTAQLRYSTTRVSVSSWFDTSLWISCTIHLKFVIVSVMIKYCSNAHLVSIVQSL